MAVTEGITSASFARDDVHDIEGPEEVGQEQVHPDGNEYALPDNGGEYHRPASPRVTRVSQAWIKANQSEHR